MAIQVKDYDTMSKLFIQQGKNARLPSASVRHGFPEAYFSPVMKAAFYTGRKDPAQ
jgi:hypothetical protein